MGEWTGDETGSAEGGPGWTRMGCGRREGGRKDKQYEIQTNAGGEYAPPALADRTFRHARQRDDELIRPPHASQLPRLRAFFDAQDRLRCALLLAGSVTGGSSARPGGAVMVRRGGHAYWARERASGTGDSVAESLEGLEASEYNARAHHGQEQDDIQKA
ncbi:hypothetical protein B0H14DRAFT_2620644 [Mycena olivaceomarginata]|nr:hypothetical protein B0H14DRAFT_2620644 [Mycena olivaceomarginata]